MAGTIRISDQDALTILRGNISQDLIFRLNRFITCAHPTGAALTGGDCPHCAAVLPGPERMPFVTQHAQTRLREHFARIGVSGALAMLRESIELDGPTVAPILNRGLEYVRDRYFLPRERRGLLVYVEDGEGGGRICTYLRFGAAQHAEVLRRWPHDGV